MCEQGRGPLLLPCEQHLPRDSQERGLGVLRALLAALRGKDWTPVLKYRSGHLRVYCSADSDEEGKERKAIWKGDKEELFLWDDFIRESQEI